jgi:hypothetical protein
VEVVGRGQGVMIWWAVWVRRQREAETSATLSFLKPEGRFPVMRSFLPRMPLHES